MGINTVQQKLYTEKHTHGSTLIRLISKAKWLVFTD